MSDYAIYLIDAEGTAFEKEDVLEFDGREQYDNIRLLLKHRGATFSTKEPQSKPVAADGGEVDSE